jgi:hypothetical protein
MLPIMWFVRIPLRLSMSGVSAIRRRGVSDAAYITVVNCQYRTAAYAMILVHSNISAP